MNWQPIPGREDQYEVSSTGLVRKRNGEILGQWNNDLGYMMVRLSNPRKLARVHRLVAAAFIPNPESLPFVNHIDCVRSNNAVENLEWCTQWQNIRHSYDLGRMQTAYWKGKRSPNARLSEYAVSEIRRLYANGGVSWDALGKKFGICKRTVGRVINRECYV